MTFASASDISDREIAPGIRMKTLAWGERTLMASFHLDQGAHLPLHSHPHEQTGYLVSGRLRLTIGKEARELGPGDGWVIPGGVDHQADALEATTALEVFSPVREEYLP